MPARPADHPAPRVRPFRRSDRDQLTDLLNRHAAAVLPGVSASVNTVLGSLEQRPDEYVTDPWVADRATLVAEDRSRLVAAAHLLRYRDDADVDPSYRGSGSVEWFLHVPAAAGSADHLMAACLAQLATWNTRLWHADGNLPVPGVYGVPGPWPHVRALYERAGFRHTGGTETLLLATVRELPTGPTPRGLTVDRTLGDLGTRFTARRDGHTLGHLEVDTGLERAERRPRDGALADLADLDLPDDAPDEVFAALLTRAAEWLRWCGADRVLAYEDDAAGAEAATDAEAREAERLRRHGFAEVTRTARGWTRARS
ncbi:GNAT family N-acetyltransferase [Streptomyces sp. AC536]|uniref:GNAT family N-acetyltransferase n=1 Tax=Streptomyces buecherae TaxID=2763006 RepID=UPI00164DF146|nr:GNAT family N-acetyltransferase [Streptomyces buecherae]MBC3982559.1 GNAT family N-acetyltransferase [Streptomyces buecherae]QNJ40997.1 GNAT family N-acetyltransferase [Streptomyces buecherae]